MLLVKKGVYPILTDKLRRIIMNYINEKVESTLNKLSRLIVVRSEKPQGFKVKKCGYKTDNNIPEVTSDWEEF